MLLIGEASFAYPITPQTLRKLIVQSQCIVIATVDNQETIEKYYDNKTKDTIELISIGGDGLADLHIKETLKGNPNRLNHIQVTYEAGMICPAPAHYPDKKVVIAFLAKEDTSNTYFTVGLSYGSKIMESETELNSFKTRIIEYLEILKIKSKYKKNKKTVEWLTKCAVDKNTRWEGAYELSRKGYYMSYYDYSKDQQFYKGLTKSQLSRLDSAFFATDTVGYSELCLANLISKNKNTKLKDHLLKSLKYSDAYITSDIMRKIIEIYPKTELTRIYERFAKLDYDDIKKRYIIEQFIIAAKE